MWRIRVDKRLCIGCTVCTLAALGFCFAHHESHPLICYSGVLLVVPALVAVNDAASARRLPLTCVPVSSDHVSSAAGLERLPLPSVTCEAP